MAVYKISSIISRLTEILNSGAIYVDLVRRRNGSLSFSAVSPDYLYPFDPVEAAEPSDYELTHEKIIADSPCHTCIFSYKELFSILNAINYAKQYFELSKENFDLTENDLSEIEQASSDYQALLSKILSLPQLSCFVSPAGDHSPEGDK